MPQVFGHKYQLFIGQPSQGLIEVHREPVGIEANIPALIKNPDFQPVSRPVDSLVTPDIDESERPVSSVTGGYIDYTSLPSQAVLIEDPIQIDATIKQSSGRTNGSTPAGTIKVYNLSKVTINQITADSTVVLKAGYTTDNELPVVFIGQIERVYTTREGADNVTTLYCKDAANPLKSAKFARSYPIGFEYQYILLDVIEEFGRNGVPFGSFIGDDRSAQAIQEGVTYNAKLGKVLSEICDEIDFTWFISKGRLYVQPRELDRLIDFVIIRPENVIGAIQPNDDKSALSVSDRSSKPPGIKVDTFLNGSVGLNTYVKIESGDFKGDYKPDSIEHRLNWYNGPWQTTIETQGVKEFANNTG